MVLLTVIMCDNDKCNNIRVFESMEEILDAIGRSTQETTTHIEALDHWFCDFCLERAMWEDGDIPEEMLEGNSAVML